jgi:hypothetical protein
MITTLATNKNSFNPKKEEEKKTLVFRADMLLYKTSKNGLLAQCNVCTSSVQ